MSFFKKTGKIFSAVLSGISAPFMSTRELQRKLGVPDTYFPITEVDRATHDLGLVDNGNALPHTTWKGVGTPVVKYLTHETCNTRVRIGSDKDGKQHCFCSACKEVLGEYQPPGWYGYKLPFKKSKVKPYVW